jgi:transcriptional regulator with XRE-family HTH domain
MKHKQLSEINQKRLEVLGQYLRENRFIHGLTLNQVANEINLHKNTIGRAETGHSINLISLFELADYYQIPLTGLLTDIQ